MSILFGSKFCQFVGENYDFREDFTKRELKCLSHTGKFLPSQPPFVYNNKFIPNNLKSVRAWAIGMTGQRSAWTTREKEKRRGNK
jgi:hypothetical protein